MLTGERGGPYQTYISSSGEMKMSLKQMIWSWSGFCAIRDLGGFTNIFMAQVLQEFQFTIRSLGQDGGAEGFHNLLDGDGSASQLVSCCADKTKSTHAHRLQFCISKGMVSGRILAASRTTPYPSVYDHHYHLLILLIPMLTLIIFPSHSRGKRTCW